MKSARLTAAVLALFALSAAAAHAQSLAGAGIPAARAGFGLSLAIGEDELFIGEPDNSTRPRSGIIIVSSIGEGLFVLKKRDTTTVF